MLKQFLKTYGLPIFLKGRGLYYSGNRVYCAVCKGKYNQWLPLGYDKRLGQCPGCRSNERDRTLWLFLDSNSEYLKKGSKVLHIAPEHHIYQRLRKNKDILYQPADKFIEGYENTYPKDTMYIDITSMPEIDDNSYDFILCTHVLECLEDDKSAMKELYRIMKPGGAAILQVPIDFNRSVTYEDWSITSPTERERVFGNKWNMRWYGRDYKDKLADVGFIIKFVAIQDVYTLDEINRFGLGQKDEIHLVSK